MSTCTKQNIFLSADNATNDEWMQLLMNERRSMKSINRNYVIIVIFRLPCVSCMH